jgi:AcrR family transcriptional regulator
MSHADHTEQTDLRVRRTQKFVQAAMIDLITEKGFAAITVGDIAERAIINRATFYRHYQDKYDLVAKIFEEAATQLMEQMKPLYKGMRQNEMKTPPAIWLQFFAHVADHAPLYRAMLGKNGSPWFADRMRQVTSKLILESEQLWEMQPNLPIDPAMPEELPAIQLAQVLIGTLVWWLENDQRYTPKQMATWFHRFAFYGYLATRGYQVSPPWQES